MKLIQTKRKLFLCGFLNTVGIRGNEAADRAAKEALDKKTDKQSHALFGSKTFNCQICTSNLAERMG